MSDNKAYLILSYLILSYHILYQVQGILLSQGGRICKVLEPNEMPYVWMSFVVRKNKKTSFRAMHHHRHIE